MRYRESLQSVLQEGVRQFGHLDVVVANAGIMPMGDVEEPMDFVDATDVDLIGVMNTVAASIPTSRTAPPSSSPVPTPA